MRSFWYDPFLWIHLAGLAALPLFLEVCIVGFAVGDPLLPAWFELFLVAIAGVVPIVWMQWRRPFYIFSVVAFALKPDQLTDDQRRLLTLFKSQRNQVIAVAVSAALFFLLQQIVGIAPLAAMAVPFPPEWHVVGILVAAIGFLGGNLFLQVPVSVASVMLTSDAAFATASPYPVEAISQSFTLLGLQVNKILPPITPAISHPPEIDQISSLVSEGTVVTTEMAAIAATEPQSTEPQSAVSETSESTLAIDAIASKSNAQVSPGQPNPEPSPLEDDPPASSNAQDPWV